MHNITPLRLFLGFFPKTTIRKRTCNKARSETLRLLDSNHVQPLKHLISNSLLSDKDAKTHMRHMRHIYKSCNS